MRIDNPTVEGSISVASGSSAVLSGSFSGSFEGDGAGLTGVAPIGGTNINVVGTTVNLEDSISLTSITATSASFVLQTFESSSTIITSGSNIFGDQAGDTQQFTGSILLNGPFVATSAEATINGDAIVTGSAQITAADTVGFSTSVKSELNSNSVISGSVQVNHDSTTGFVANEHIDHSTVSITAGNGLTGGGTIAASRTLNIGAGTGIDVAADSISVDVSDFMSNGSNDRVLTATGADAMNAEANLTFNGTTLTITGNINTGQGATEVYLMNQNVRTSDSVTFAGITESSTRKLKKNIITLGDSLSKVLQLNPVEFDWISDDRHDIGLIAEEVDVHYPELVNKEDGEVTGINYSRLTAVLIGAVQELTKRVEELENK